MSFCAPMERCAFLRLRFVMGSRSVGTNLMNWTAGNEPRAVSIVVLMASAASQINSFAMERKTAWMAQMRWAAVSRHIQFCRIH